MWAAATSSFLAAFSYVPAATSFTAAVVTSMFSSITAGSTSSPSPLRAVQMPSSSIAYTAMSSTFWSASAASHVWQSLLSFARIRGADCWIARQNVHLQTTWVELNQGIDCGVQEGLSLALTALGLAAQDVAQPKGRECPERVGESACGGGYRREIHKRRLSSLLGMNFCRLLLPHGPIRH
ncbi:hypothetical protein CALCODRAFT_513132 [Calocera cornea HHB12733]|uniref:Uncharacterized protein n=1 Tax=Calocera cornea HHB12733 TaxID=1353952 RepID=A0A165CFC8_9BASI|nr:hypothetical protein CALCODRAFT_513132 [Calocera cornea HHB12733]